MSQKEIWLVDKITSGPAGPSCVKGVDHCSTVMVNFRSLPNPYLLTYRDKNWPQWLRLATHKDCQVWCKSDQRWRPHVCVKYSTVVTFFPFFFFFFILGHAPRPNAAADLHAKWLKRRGLAQGWPFLWFGLQKTKGWGYLNRKTPKIWTGIGIFHVNENDDYLENGVS